MKAIILSGFFFAVTVFLPEWNANADRVPEIQWSRGAIVLADQQVLTGEFCVQVVFDLVLFRDSNSVNVFPAHMISSLQVYDQGANINRRFVVQQTTEHGFTEYRMFEVVVHGALSVMRRQKVSAGDLQTLSNVYDFDYFIVLDHETWFLQQFREKVYPVILRSCDADMSGFIRDHKLNPNDAAAAIALIQYYNRHCADAESVKGASL